MPYRVTGTTNDTCRIFLFNDADMSLERTNIFEPGGWELLTTNNYPKLIVARGELTAESHGYGDVIPAFYEYSSSPLAIDTNDTLLAINIHGDALLT